MRLTFKRQDAPRKRCWRFDLVPGSIENFYGQIYLPLLGAPDPVPNTLTIDLPHWPGPVPPTPLPEEEMTDA